MKRKPLIYVAGPMTVGYPTVLHNLANAHAAAARLRDYGLVGIVPHDSILLDGALKLDYEEWMEIDFQIILRCDGLIRLPGESKGADREVAFAKTLNLPVSFHPLSWEQACDNIISYFKERGDVQP